MEIPSPDINQSPSFGRHLTVVETTYADENWARVSITRDDRGIYRVHPERWEISDLTVIGRAYWNPLGHGDSLTDDISIARQMAADELRKVHRSTIIPDS
jgi:hypothetical protein